MPTPVIFLNKGNETKESGKSHDFSQHGPPLAEQIENTREKRTAMGWRESDGGPACPGPRGGMPRPWGSPCKPPWCVADPAAPSCTAEVVDTGGVSAAGVGMAAVPVRSVDPRVKSEPARAAAVTVAVAVAVASVGVGAWAASSPELAAFGPALTSAGSISGLLEGENGTGPWAAELVEVATGGSAAGALGAGARGGRSPSSTPRVDRSADPSRTYVYERGHGR